MNPAQTSSCAGEASVSVQLWSKPTGGDDIRPWQHGTKLMRELRIGDRVQVTFSIRS